jgi:hypothetical protein
MSSTSLAQVPLNTTGIGANFLFQNNLQNPIVETSIASEAFGFPINQPFPSYIKTFQMLWNNISGSCYDAGSNNANISKFKLRFYISSEPLPSNYDNNSFEANQFDDNIASFQATNAAILWSYKEQHQKFCIEMHTIATSLNSLPLRQNNISDNDYDVVLINHYSDVLKDYLRYTDINEDVRFGQRQHLNLYRKRDDRSWTMTHGCGQCGYRVPVQLELSTFIIYSVGLIVYHHSVGMKSISKRKPHGK